MRMSKNTLLFGMKTIDKKHIISQKIPIVSSITLSSTPCLLDVYHESGHIHQPCHIETPKKSKNDLEDTYCARLRITPCNQRYLLPGKMQKFPHEVKAFRIAHRSNRSRNPLLENLGIMRKKAR